MEEIRSNMDQNPRVGGKFREISLGGKFFETEKTINQDKALGDQNEGLNKRLLSYC